MKDDRRELIGRRARELAESGDFEDHRGIEVALIVEGYPDAPERMEDAAFCAILKAQCDVARQTRKPA